MRSLFWKRAIAAWVKALYRASLLAYPTEFRRRYGREMEQVVSDELRAILRGQSDIGLIRFVLHLLWDQAEGVVLQHVESIGVGGVVSLAIAVVFGMCAVYVDHHAVHEVYPTLSTALVGSLLLGLMRPIRPWRWALVIGCCIAFIPWGQPLHGPLERIATPGSWAVLGVVMVPGLVGVYCGAFLRRGIMRLLTP